MKKKVVAAALICSVLGSSHASNNEKFDDYGGNYQSEVQRPVQRLDRFRRYGNKGTPQVENRFSKKNQTRTNYVVNDQTGEKVYLGKGDLSRNQHRSPQFAPQTNQYQDRNFQAADRFEENRHAQRPSNAYESSRFEVDHPQKNKPKVSSKYDFTGPSSGQVDSQQRRPHGNTHGRFAAASSHRQKLDQVNRNDSQSWNQKPSGSEAWDNSDKYEPKEQAWKNSYPAKPSRDNWNHAKSNNSHWNSVQQPSNTMRNGNDQRVVQRKPMKSNNNHWNSMQQPSNMMSNGHDQRVDQHKPVKSNNNHWNAVQQPSNMMRNGNDQRVDQHKPVKSENYAMDRRSFWPTRDQQTRHVDKANRSEHNGVGHVPNADRRIHSRMEKSNAVVTNRTSNFDRRTIQPQRPQVQQTNDSQYQSLRRPRVRVDLTKNQMDRRKRQRRSWLPNPFRGVSRMFSGIFGRR